MAENYHKEMNSTVRSAYASKEVAEILKQVSMIDEVSKKASLIEFHVRAMEAEMRIINDLKRDVPHCTHFLEDAIGHLKEDLLRWKRLDKQPVMEEFIPLKSGFGGCVGTKGSCDINEKKEWMSSAQLWCTPIQNEDNSDTQNQDFLLLLKSSYQGEQGSGSENLFQGCNSMNNEGVFLPFNLPMRKDNGVSLSDPVAEVESFDLNVNRDLDSQLEEPHQRQQQRKQRRCWSPELHKMFVDALNQLGGQQTATPKHIKELMKVDGLTIDEVKSHLQKYRLHIRKLPSSSSAEVLNYSWLTQDQYGLMVLYNSSASSPQIPFYPAAGGSAKRGATFTSLGETMEDQEDQDSWKIHFERPNKKR